MIRDRAWRRHMEERHLIRRLRKLCEKSRWYYGFEDINGIIHNSRKILDYIGTKDYYLSKTLSTTVSISKYKVKYSPNRSRDYYRDEKPRGQSYGLREKDKVILLKIIKENGLK